MDTGSVGHILTWHAWDAMGHIARTQERTLEATESLRRKSLSGGRGHEGLGLGGEDIPVGRINVKRLSTNAPPSFLRLPFSAVIIGDEPSHINHGVLLLGAQNDQGTTDRRDRNGPAGGNGAVLLDRERHDEVSLSR